MSSVQVREVHQQVMEAAGHLLPHISMHTIKVGNRVLQGLKDNWDSVVDWVIDNWDHLVKVVVDFIQGILSG
jgi:hypothetical protein